ncbi:MAG: hypothetical protein WBM46_07290 [Polyangiales bacterium]
MKLCSLTTLLLLSAAAGCGSGGPEGTGGSGGDPLAERSAYRLTCTIDTLVIEIPIELSYELDQPYIVGGSADLTFSATVTFTEEASATLIDAGISKIDIISMQIASGVEGATPAMVETSLAAAPINDFDLEPDTNDDGLPGPHRLELEPVVTTTTVAAGADQVEFMLRTDQVSMILGDFAVPTDCLGPTLVGFTARFAVEPSS